MESGNSQPTPQIQDPPVSAPQLQTPPRQELLVAQNEPLKPKSTKAVKWILILIGIIVLINLVGFGLTKLIKPKNNSQNPTPYESPTNYSPENESSICGGIAGKTCQEGYTCILEGNYPDASGTCILDSTLQK